MPGALLAKVSRRNIHLYPAAPSPIGLGLVHSVGGRCISFPFTTTRPDCAAYVDAARLMKKNEHADYCASHGIMNESVVWMNNE